MVDRHRTAATAYVWDRTQDYPRDWQSHAADAWDRTPDYPFSQPAAIRGSVWGQQNNKDAKMTGRGLAGLFEDLDEGNRNSTLVPIQT